MEYVSLSTLIELVILHSGARKVDRVEMTPVV